MRNLVRAPLGKQAVVGNTAMYFGAPALFSTTEITHSNASGIGSEPIFSYVHFQCEAINGLTVTL